MITKSQAASLCRTIRKDFPGEDLLDVKVSPCGIVSAGEDPGCFCKETWEEKLPKAAYEAVVLPIPALFHGMPESVKAATVFPYWKAMLSKDGESSLDLIESESLRAFAHAMSVLSKEEQDPYIAVKRAVKIVRACGGLRVFESLFGLSYNKAPIGGVIN
jgi:hypothetical protein